MATHHLTDITYHKQRRLLAVTFDNGEHYELPAEYLRVFSPSAEVRGHGAVKPKRFITGKTDVDVTELQPIGNYAIKIHFDDGHNSGLFDWDYLYLMASHYEQWWREYREKTGQVDKTDKTD